MHFEVIDTEEKLAHRDPSIPTVKSLVTKYFVHGCNLINIHEPQ